MIGSKISYKIEKPETVSPESVTSLSEELSCPEFVSRLLISRGYHNKSSVREFFLADPGVLQNMSEMKGFEEAVDLLLTINKKQSRIIVYGDYDVDGITATAILYSGLKRCGFNVDWFLPNRFHDGYGLSISNIEKFHKDSVDWIITVDTGTSAVQEINRAKELGMGVIVTDHHQLSEDLPQADVIVNPNQPGCAYKNKSICGAGLAFLIAHRLSTIILNDPAEDLLELMAIAGLADIVPLTQENRFFIRKGLRLMPNTKRPGLRRLLSQVGLGKDMVCSVDVLFKISPLLNAPGRMQSPDLSFLLLTTESESEAESLMKEILKLNDKRKAMDREIFTKAFSEAEKQRAKHNYSCFVLSSEFWHEGVVGIVAAKLSERLCRPVFVLTESDGIARGSGRSVPGIDLHKSLKQCGDLFEQWGGHASACGVTLKKEKIQDFRENMDKIVSKSIQDEIPVKRFTPHVSIELSDINEELMVWLKRFEPFGPLNDNPLFYIHKAVLDGTPRVVGKEHLRFHVTNGWSRFQAIGFGLGWMGQILKAGQSVNLACYPEWNDFQGRRQLQLRVIALA